jgi:hypothetical protein
MLTPGETCQNTATASLSGGVRTRKTTCIRFQCNLSAILKKSFSATSHRQSLSPAPKEPPRRQARTKHHSRKTAAHNSSAERNIQHLHAVALTAAIHEPVRIVGARELLAFWHRDFEEVAQRLPALTHLVLEQVLRGHERADLGVVLVEAALAVLFEVAFPEFGPEFY